MSASCSHCSSCNTVVLQQRALVVCGDCEHINGAEDPAAHPTFAIYDRPKLHIFLSCLRKSTIEAITHSVDGHDRYQQLALRLKDQLQERGHEVWVDVEKLTPGVDWEEGIANGLTWVKEAQENGRILLLMTPHALRRPDGYCLNEIARATQLKLHIFPTLVCESEPPPAINMLPYFDMQDCVPSIEVAQTLDYKSKEWQAAMATHLNSSLFLTKSLKLFALLEMCDSMTNNMVTVVAGVENLGLFADGPASPKSGHVPTYRKLLSPRHAPAESSFREGKRRDSGFGTAIVPAEEPRDASLVSSTRYVFVFDATSAPLAMKLHADLTAQGVCLNDITAAMSSNVGFVPLMIRHCEIPLSICRIQWLDLVDCLIDVDGHPAVNEAKYAQRLEQLVTALRGKLDHDGLQARLFSLFSPFSFQTQISKYTQGFAGREWVLAQLDQWKETRDQVFWVTGQIGTGKSALAAYIIQNRPEVRAFHLVCKEDEQTQSHRRCILSLAYQLTTQLPEYASFLQQGAPLEEVVPVSTVAELLNTLLVVPLNAIAEPATIPLVILLDGLDSLEDAKEAENCLVSALPAALQKLPSWVRLILTSREDPVVMRKLQGYTPCIALDKCVENSKQDIVCYLQKALLPYIPSSANGVVPIITLQFIACRAEGLFLYASHIVHALAQHRLTLDHLEGFPTGMGGYLRQFFESQFTPEHYKEHIRPLLEVLCAAYEPLNLHMLRAIMQWDSYVQHEMLASFKSLLYVTDSNVLKPFHTSVLEWLQDSNAAGPFYARVEHGHERIGLWAWKEYSTVIKATTDISNINFELEPSGLDDIVLHQLRGPIYIIRHALNHLREANTEASIQCMQNFSSDEKFQVARNLTMLRQSGLESFYHGDMDRLAAQALLMPVGTPGAFLIRYSANQKSYCASFIDKIVDGQPQIKHNVIYHLESGAYSAVQPKDVQPTTPIYSDLLSFVEAYQRKDMLQSIVVVGGGYSGIEFAQALASELPPSVGHITVIDKQTFTFHHDAIPRGFVQRDFVPKLFVPSDKAVPTNTTMVHGIVEAIGDSRVIVRSVVDGQPGASTRTIAYDYLVLATGSSYPAPIKVPGDVYSRAAIEAAIFETHDHIAAANSVLVVGGGSVGCEVAGEIACAYPEKTVTLVDGNDYLVASGKMTAEFRSRLLDALTACGVRVILGERPVERMTTQSYERRTITLTKGTKITSDVQLLCAGMTPNTKLMELLDSKLVTPKGIKVKRSMQVDDDRFTNIFVIGDASNHPSPKTAHIAGDQAEFLAHALVEKIVSGTPIGDFDAGPTEGLMVPIGPEGGVAQLLNGVVEGAWLVQKKKHKDYNTARVWAHWNATMPQ
ncbi:hypothetical protein ACHHYP_04691 [Achlya hypogyna]|uniref:SH2 domain-containing protein n=1 Tax=Achlya hypogyna TaxID=1202772 RepID=A0A1V9Z0I3_ACHHY|nr:hypothetical protein ACHHYP_04691 [Achlya hypogyna]